MVNINCLTQFIYTTIFMLFIVSLSFPFFNFFFIFLPNGDLFIIVVKIFALIIHRTIIAKLTATTNICWENWTVPIMLVHFEVDICKPFVIPPLVSVPSALFSVALTKFDELLPFFNAFPFRPSTEVCRITIMAPSFFVETNDIVIIVSFVSVVVAFEFSRVSVIPTKIVLFVIGSSPALYSPFVDTW